MSPSQLFDLRICFLFEEDPKALAVARRSPHRYLKEWHALSAMQDGLADREDDHLIRGFVSFVDRMDHRFAKFLPAGVQVTRGDCVVFGVIELSKYAYVCGCQRLKCAPIPRQPLHPSTTTHPHHLVPPPLPQRSCLPSRPSDRQRGVLLPTVFVLVEHTHEKLSLRHRAAQLHDHIRTSRVFGAHAGMLGDKPLAQEQATR